MATGPGRDVDDRAVLLLAHRRQHRAHAIEYAVEIDIDELIPAFQFHVGPAPLRHIDPGTVDLEIDAAVPCQNLRGGLVDIGGHGDIERDRFGLAAGLPDFLDHRIKRALAAPGYDHRPAVGGKSFGACLANAGAAAGHPGHALPVPSHANCLRCFFGAVFA